MSAAISRRSVTTAHLAFSPPTSARTSVLLRSRPRRARQRGPRRWLERTRQPGTSAFVATRALATPARGAAAAAARPWPLLRRVGRLRVDPSKPQRPRRWAKLRRRHHRWSTSGTSVLQARHPVGSTAIPCRRHEPAEADGRRRSPRSWWASFAAVAASWPAVRARAPVSSSLAALLVETLARTWSTPASSPGRRGDRVAVAGDTSEFCDRVWLEF